MRVQEASRMIFLSEVNICVDGKLRHTHTSVFGIQTQFPSEVLEFHCFLQKKRKRKKDLLSFVKFCVTAAKFNYTQLYLSSVCFGKKLEKLKVIFLQVFNNLRYLQQPLHQVFGPSMPSMPAMVFVHYDSFLSSLVIGFSILQIQS